MLSKSIILLSIFVSLCIGLVFIAQKLHLAETNTVEASTVDRNFFRAAHLGQIDVVRTYIKNGTDPNAINSDGQGMTALMYAASGGKVEVIRYLLAHQADINRRKKSGATALMLAANTNNEEAVNVLLENRAEPNIKDEMENTALIFAVLRENQNIIRILSNKGLGLNQWGVFGRSPLMIAAARGKLNSVRTILALPSGRNQLNEVDVSKRTPLMLAVKESQLAIIQELFLRNPNLNAKDIQGKTALDLAEENATRQDSEHGRAIISLLRARGAIRGTPLTIPNWRNNAPRQARR